MILGAPSESLGLQKDPMRLSRSAGGVQNVSLEPWSPTFEELVEATSTPQAGDKDGSYFVRGPCGEAATRNDEQISEANLIVLDADKRFDPNTGELISGAPHPSLVHEVLRKLNLRHHIYTSHSHGAEGKGNRYRVLLPAPLGSDPRALAACVDYLLDEIQAAGVPLATVQENYRWSQAWFFPRIRSGDVPFMSYTYAEGVGLDVESVKEEWLRKQPTDIEVATAESEDVPGIDIIGRFLREHGDPDTMATYLERHGYTLVGAGQMNDAPSYRFLAPNSQSGAPGVVLFRTQRGRWRVVSFHGENDPLAVAEGRSGKPLAHDAFDLFRILEHGGDLRAALAAADPRPVIQTYAGSLSESTRGAIKALAAQEPPIVFQRGTLLTRPTHLPDLVEAEGVRYPEGTAVLSVLDAPSLRLQLADAARFLKLRSGNDDWIDIDPPKDLVQSVLGAAGDWDELPVLVGIADAPILRADGTVFDQAGYDPETRMYYAGRAPKLMECAEPSREDALRALDQVMAPFAEFPFSKPDQDRAVVLAYLMTLALRPILARAPLFVFTATTPGAGKGLLVEACNLIVRGKDAAIMAPAGGRDMDEETRKRITSILLQGGSSVLIDNWTSAVGGNALNTLFTSDEWTDRVLGNSQMTTLPTRVTWAATGNNVTVRGDMTRRSVVAELDPAVERPELRSFKVDNLPKYVLDNQGELLSALYTILRAYRQADEPERDGPLLGRFEDWSRMVAAPIRWLGLPDPIDSQERLREDDPETRAHGALLLAWEGALGDRWVTVAELILDRDPGGYHGPDTEESRKKNALKEALEAVADNNGNGKVNRRVLGWYLTRFASRVCEDRMIEKDTTRKDRARYRVIRLHQAAA